MLAHLTFVSPLLDYIMASVPYVYEKGRCNEETMKMFIVFMNVAIIGQAFCWKSMVIKRVKQGLQELVILPVV